VSVPVPERDPSDMEFVTNARNLQIETIKRCKNLNKSYTFYVGIPLANIARNIRSYTKRANSINPTNKHEAQMRIDQLLYAKAEVHNMISEVEIAAEIVENNFNKKEFMKYLDAELKLLSGVIKSDRARYRRLP
jgi:hypothetical protein